MANIPGFKAPASSRTPEYQRIASQGRDSFASDGYRYSYTDYKSAEPLHNPFESAHDAVKDTDSKVSRHSSASNTVDCEREDLTLHGDEYPLIPKVNVVGGN